MSARLYGEFQTFSEQRGPPYHGFSSRKTHCNQASHDEFTPFSLHETTSFLKKSHKNYKCYFFKRLFENPFFFYIFVENFWVEIIKYGIYYGNVKKFLQCLRYFNEIVALIFIFCIPRQTSRLNPPQTAHSESDFLILYANCAKRG